MEFFFAILNFFTSLESGPHRFARGSDTVNGPIGIVNGPIG
jgi:hypothetical protein